MPYSEKDMEEISRDPVRLRCYFWHMAMHWRRMARRDRASLRREGFDPSILERVADEVLEHIDALVETTCER